MEERPGAVTFMGNPLTLVGREIHVGDRAPDFETIGNDMETVRFDSLAGKVRILSSVPSLDTPVCDTETRRFNEEASRFGEGVVILTVSMDLPFAQKRWCGAAGVTTVKTLSDHREAGFGLAYGVLIKELRLLARAVFLVDGSGVVKYIQLVKEMTHEPDYEALWNAVRKIV
ncbi:MAG: thiol peroxidase [Deltaproteobacteria bacterium]|nr:thiol peroxidase [Deltaproteobacteria bacterium]MBW2123237.1 thiol peroxidase [Deltaproteobacteria bacterium]